MSSINLDGLPEPVVQSIQAMVAHLKEQYSTATETLSPLERMKRAAGGWSDDPVGLDEYLEEVRRSRSLDRLEPTE